MIDTSLIVLLGGLILLVVYIYYRKLKDKPKDPKVLFKDVHIPPTTKGMYKYWSYPENDTEVPKKE